MHYTPRVAPGFWSLGLELNTPITLSIIRFWNVLQTKSELWVSVKVYPTKTMLPGEYISLTWGVLVFYLKILIGHPWNQSWGGFSSAEATSEVAQEVGKGERESDNLEEPSSIFLQGGFFYWSALKMTKSQPLKEFSELVLPKKRLRMKKVKVPELVLLYSRTSSNTLIFIVKIYWVLTLRTFQEEQFADQFRYFNFSSYLVFFRADQSKKPPCIKYWMEMKYSPPTQAISALGRKLQWKRRESKKQGQQRDPPKILTPCNILSPGFEGWKTTPRLLKACAGPPLPCSQRPRWTHPRRWYSSTTWLAICSQVLSCILAEDLSPARMRPLTFLTVQKSRERRRMMRTKLPMKLSENQPHRR